MSEPTVTLPEPGSLWIEKRTGRTVKILEACVHDTGPAWTYCDSEGKPEPHGHEAANGFYYGDWFWHYSDLWDFTVYHEFTPKEPAHAA